MSMEPHVAERPKEKRPVPPVTQKPIDTPGPEVVPDTVLEELLAAFSQPEAADAKSFDFDDPSIDRLLGLGDDAPAIEEPKKSEPADEPNATTTEASNAVDASASSTVLLTPPATTLPEVKSASVAVLRAIEREITGDGELYFCLAAVLGAACEGHSS